MTRAQERKARRQKAEVAKAAKASNKPSTNNSSMPARSRVKPTLPDKPADPAQAQVTPEQEWEKQCAHVSEAERRKLNSDDEELVHYAGGCVVGLIKALPGLSESIWSATTTIGSGLVSGVKNAYQYATDSKFRAEANPSMVIAFEAATDGTLISKLISNAAQLIGQQVNDFQCYSNVRRGEAVCKFFGEVAAAGALFKYLPAILAGSMDILGDTYGSLAKFAQSAGRAAGEAAEKAKASEGAARAAGEAEKVAAEAKKAKAAAEAEAMTKAAEAEAKAKAAAAEAKAKAAEAEAKANGARDRSSSEKDAKSEADIKGSRDPEFHVAMTKISRQKWLVDRRMDNPENARQLLGLGRGASNEEIKRAHRSWTLRFVKVMNEKAHLTPEEIDYLGKFQKSLNVARDTLLRK